MRKTILCIALLIFFSTFAYAPLPVISNPSPTGELDYGTTGIILNVHTDVISTCKYSLVSGVAFSEMPFQFVTTDDTNHAVALGTENGVQYTYYIKCKYNNLGQETVDYPVSFSVSGVNPCNPNELICSGECTVPECTSNLDCPEIEGNQWVCISPLSCNSYCDSNSGCVPECTSNAECNDSNPNTTDVCQNLGSCEASCSNSSCVSICSLNSDCDDNDIETLDSCVNPGSCSAYCNNSCITPICSVDVDCDDSNSMTTDTCLNAGTCNSSCQYVDLDCDIICSSNLDCDDSDSETSDVCSNAGTCSSECNNLYCDVECSSNSECNDLISTTTDVCVNSGTCNANCQNYACSIACLNNAGCDDHNLRTEDSCTNAGTCEASCSNETIILDCTPVCYYNSDCEDGDLTTTNRCYSGGTCDARCTSQQCNILCASESDCDDGVDLTTDTCLNPNTCISSCINSNCTPVCASGSDCDDSNPNTKDVCAGAGRCTATCENLTSCGNSVCDVGETQCSCPEDCGTCSGSESQFYELACIGNSCKNILKSGICGNDRCELFAGENYFTCDLDCSPKSVIFDFNFTDDFYVRGENVLVKAEAEIDGVKANNLFLRAEGFFGDIPLFNDGKNNDAEREDNVYANYFLIDNNSAKGNYSVNVYSEIDGKIYKSTKNIFIEPKISVNAGFKNDFYVLGDNIVFDGNIFLKGKPLENEIKFKLEREGEIIEETTSVSTDGKINFEYRTTLIDSPGEYILSVSAEDPNNNYFSDTFEIDVFDPDATNFLVVEVETTEQKSFKKGAIATFEVNVLNIAGKPVKDAVVTGLSNLNQEITFTHQGEGKYFGTLSIPMDSPSGELIVKVNALSQNREGSFEFSILIQPIPVSVEIIQPEEHLIFQIGEKIPLEVLVSYENQSIFVTGDVYAIINGQEIKLESGIETGTFRGEYIVPLELEGISNIEFVADSGKGDLGKAKREIEVSGISIEHYLRTYNISISLILFALGLILVLLYAGYKYKGKIWYLKRKEKIILEKIKGAQEQYFVQKDIDKKAYDKILKSLEPELSDTRETLKALQNKK